MKLMAENDFEFAWSRALMCQRRIVMRVRESSRASMLEEIRVTRRTTCLWAVVMVAATKLICPERGAAALTPYNFPIRSS